LKERLGNLVSQLHAGRRSRVICAFMCMNQRSIVCGEDSVPGGGGNSGQAGGGHRAGEL